MGSSGTLGNSSRMNSTRRDVAGARFREGSKDASDADRNVSGTRIRHGLCRCIWWRVLTYVWQSASWKAGVQVLAKDVDGAC